MQAQVTDALFQFLAQRAFAAAGLADDGNEAVADGRIQHGRAHVAAMLDGKHIFAALNVVHKGTVRQLEVAVRGGAEGLVSAEADEVAAALMDLYSLYGQCAGLHADLVRAPEGLR